ncbi:ATP-binding protein [Mycetocola sp. 2940]|uniref:sensor histidine kinase n=1 Tax=Mycetocola sp. 2940 TaxID=3156452 RepID=UPI0033992F55
MTGARSEGLGSRWFGFRPEVAFQLANVLVVLVAILIAALIDPAPLRTTAFAIAIVIFAVATVLSLILGRTGSSWLLVVPVLGMIALIIMRQVPEDHIHALGYMAVFPALWLGWSGRPWFAALAVLLSLGMVEVPGLSAGGHVDLEHALRNFLTPAVVAVAAASTCIASRRTTSIICSLITQEKATADALRREQHTSQMLDAIVDAVDTAVLAFDADGNRILANQKALQHPSILDADPTALEAGSLFEPDRVTPVPADDGFIARALRGQEFADRIVWVGEPGTRQYAVSASARTLLDAQGRFGGTVVAMNDVTTYLETIAAKDDFVASVSHELRTPLASIVGYLELLEDDDDVPESVRPSLAVIDRNSRRLQRLITDLLATATNPSAPPLHRQSTDISDLCGAVVANLAKSAAAKQVRLRLHAPEPVVAMVDRERVRLAIDNLVANAVKFGPAGDVDVTVRSGDGTVTVEVADTGIGIPADELSAVTARFYRATTVRQHFPGLGLGLSVSASIVDAHGGTVAVASTERQGTTVTVTLPAR